MRLCCRLPRLLAGLAKFVCGDRRRFEPSAIRQVFFLPLCAAFTLLEVGNAGRKLTSHGGSGM